MSILSEPFTENLHIWMPVFTFGFVAIIIILMLTSPPTDTEQLIKIMDCDVLQEFIIHTDYYQVVASTEYLERCTEGLK